MSSFFSKAKNVSGQGILLIKSGAEKSKGISTVGAAKGIGIFFVIVIVIIIIIYVSRSLNVGFGDLFSGLSADRIAKNEAANAAEDIKELDVELKEQLEDATTRSTDILLDAEHTTTEEIKRVVEKEAAQTEASLIDKLAEIQAAIFRQIRITDIKDDTADKFRRLQDIWARLQRGERVESYELKEFNDAILTGVITVNGNTGVITNNLR